MKQCHLLQRTRYFADFHLEYIAFPEAIDNWHLLVSDVSLQNTQSIIFLWFGPVRTQKNPNPKQSDHTFMSLLVRGYNTIKYQALILKS